MANRISFACVIASAVLFVSFPIERAQAGDFLNPAPAQLDSSFRNNRLNLELQRRNQANAAMAGGGGGGMSYDEYQQSGSYQNVIWVPLENIGAGATINVNIGESSQSATNSNSNASNTVSEQNTTNGACGGAVLNAAHCGGN